jgi:hypothetical protein
MPGRSLTLVVLAILSSAFAQDRAPGGRGAPGQPTLTRSASKYQALEVSLIEALGDRSGSKLDRILAGDFEVWSAERSGPTLRQDWQKAAFATRVQPSRIRDLTVREFGEIAVVSFLLEGDPAGRGATPTVFVVDIWTQSTNTLNVRYLSTPAKPAPGQLRRQ